MKNLIKTLIKSQIAILILGYSALFSGSVVHAQEQANTQSLGLPAVPANSYFKAESKPNQFIVFAGYAASAIAAIVALCCFIGAGSKITRGDYGLGVAGVVGGMVIASGAWFIQNAVS